jgi:hypothetical protein
MENDSTLWLLRENYRKEVALSLRAPAIFSYHRLQRFFVQTQVCHQLPQSRVLIPQLFRLLRLVHNHPAVLCLPGTPEENQRFIMTLKKLAKGQSA